MLTFILVDYLQIFGTPQSMEILIKTKFFMGNVRQQYILKVKN